MGSSSSNFEKNYSSESLLPLLLLSLTKIKDFKDYFENYSELYQNKNELIQIFIDLIKKEKPVDDIVLQNNLLLTIANNPFSIKKFYKSKLYELNKQLEKINKIKQNATDSIIKKLFWGKEKKISICSLCKETKRNDKEKIICLSFNLEDINDRFDASETLSGAKNYEKKKHCYNKEDEADFNIKCNYDLPNIMLIILYNYTKKTKINFVLSKGNFGIQYDLICFITQSGEMVFKEADNQWYLYSIKRKENMNIDMNQKEIEKYNPIVFFYQKIEKKIILHEAIIEYVKLQKEIKKMENNQIKQLYLAPKKFFDDIFELIGINPDNLIINQDQDNIHTKIEECKKELMSMEQLKIMDIDSIEENPIFVNENILDKLGIEKEEYKKKKMKLIKNDEDNFKMIFENKGSIIITKEGTIIFLNDLTIINNNTDNTEPSLIKIKVFYDNIYNIIEQQQNISKLINENKIDENKLENYYIINVKWFYKMIKILESDEIYENDNYKIESFDKIVNINDLNENDFKIKNELFIQRKQILLDENLFKVQYEEKNNIKYPNKFVIIKENDLNDLLKEFQVSFINNIQNNIYNIFYGNKYLFIKDNNEKNKYFVCSRKSIEFKVEIIFNFIEDKYFKKEIDKFFKGQNEFIDYFKERRIDMNNSQLQKIINKEQVLIGNVIIIDYINKNNNNDNNLLVIHIT